MLTLASLARVAKNYALDSSISDEVFLNALLDPYVQKGRVRGRNGADFYLDKFRTSKILNGKADVPVPLKKPLAKFGIEENTASEFRLFIDEYLDERFFNQLSNDILALVDGEDTASKRFKEELAKLIERHEFFLAHAFIASIKESNLAVSTKTVWQNGTGSLAVEIGDLLDKGFGKTRKFKDIVVIPVNTAFDTEVTWGYEKSQAPLVSERSIHGQWLVRMFRSGQTSDTLTKRIQDDLAARNENIEGKWPIGTIAVVENNRAVFFLTAISAFDKNNNAQSSLDLIGQAMESLLHLYDKRGQGMDMYMPLLGTGMSRAGLSHAESYELIMRTVLENRHLVHGKLIVMIHPNDRQKVTV